MEEERSTRLRPPPTLLADLGDHVSLTASRWRIASVVHVVTGVTWEAVALDWRAWHDLEEIPTHLTWFIIDEEPLDGSAVLAY